MIAQRRLLRRPARALVAGPPGRPRTRTIVLILALGLLLGSWLWLRDSALVAVKRVSVIGLSGPDATKIRSALVTAARNMTTLDVRTDELQTAAAPFPIVKKLQVSTRFPHGLRIRVVEQIPVGAVVVGSRSIPVAGDGTLLHDLASSAGLPTIPLTIAPGGSRLSEPDALHAVALLGAAPYPLLAHISQVTTMPAHGLVAQLRNGPSLYFGDAGRLPAKWLAATAVLADAGSAGAAYVDVSDPGRPAAGASGNSSAPSSGAAQSSTASPSSGTTTALSSRTATTPSAIPPTSPALPPAGG